MAKNIALAEEFPETKLTCVGKVTADPAVLLRDLTGARPLPDGGYQHFDGAR